jgi:aminoglycoside 3-N-acetyltransferase
MVDYNKFMEGIERIAPGGVLIHSDLRWGFPFEPEKGKRVELLAKHYGALAAIFGNIPLFMPAFNYSFLSQKRYDVQQSPSEVGVLTEYFRKHVAVFRSRDPVFSFCGNTITDYRDPVASNAVADPFGSDSFFQYLYDNNGLIFRYGSHPKNTIIHFIERKLGTVPYRYDKYFDGCITDAGEEFRIRYLYHVRPLTNHLDYDWGRVMDDLAKEGILVNYQNDRTSLDYFSVRAITDYLLMKLERDPFYLLDQESSDWVIPAIRKLQRNFLLEDFE